MPNIFFSTAKTQSKQLHNPPVEKHWSRKQPSQKKHGRLPRRERRQKHRLKQTKATLLSSWQLRGSRCSEVHHHLGPRSWKRDGGVDDTGGCGAELWVQHQEKSSGIVDRKTPAAAPSNPLHCHFIGFPTLSVSCRHPESLLTSLKPEISSTFSCVFLKAAYFYVFYSGRCRRQERSWPKRSSGILPSCRSY